jgi:two-component system sensor histidine kinase KdpD
MRRDWESAEEIVGTVLRRVRQRDSGARVRTRVQPDLPLLHWTRAAGPVAGQPGRQRPQARGRRCRPVEVVARRAGNEVLIAVRDRGPGVPGAA